MNTDRQIRFLYPPVLVLAFFFWRLVADSHVCAEVKSALDTAKSAGSASTAFTTVIAAGTLILVVGYVLSTITYLLLRAVSLIFGRPSHEAAFKDSDRELVWKAVMPAAVAYKPEEAWLASVWIDAKLSGKGINEWLGRRWNGFNLAASISLGTSLTMLCFICWLPHWPTPKHWWCVGFGILIVFGCIAVLAWQDTMRMIRFSAQKLVAERALRGTSSVPVATTSSSSPDPAPKGDSLSSSS